MWPLSGNSVCLEGADRPMQSSTAIAIRALIMLIVLVSVPLFAIFGKNLPEVVKGLLEGRGLVLTPAPGAMGGAPPISNVAAPPQAGSDPSGQAGFFRSGTDIKLPAGIAPPTTQPPGLIGGHSVSPPTAGGMNQTAVANPGMAAVAADLNTTNPFANPSAARFDGAHPHVNVTGESEWKGPPKQDLAQPAGFQTPESATPLTPQSPAANSTAQNVDPMAGPIATTAAAPAPLPATNDDRFRQAEARLRELGATHYMLETWGPDNNRYRFVCKMAIGGNAGVNRYFQAIEDDPCQAMTEVLHQVEQWRAQPQR